MKILATRQLTKCQAESLKNLIMLCQDHNKLRLSCPLDADRFYLLLAQEEQVRNAPSGPASGEIASGGTASGETSPIRVAPAGTIPSVPASTDTPSSNPPSHLSSLASALAVFEEDGVWECYAFTRPDLRRTHCFSQLLDRLEQDAQEQDPEPELCFVADPACEAAQKTLTAIGAQLWYEEHAMVWKAGADDLGQQAGAADKPQPSGASSSISLEFSSQGLPVHFPPLSIQRAPLPERLDILARTRDGQPVGACSLYLQPPSACLFEVEIQEPLRGQGLGEAMVRELLRLAPDMGLSAITLQVSGDNTPAVNLYKKTGFHITETLSYYLY